MCSAFRCLRPVLLIAVACAAFTVADAGAQDTHYWNTQYGPRGTLLGGLVIGSVNDMSGTFYNPGVLGYIEEPELLLSANVYRASKLTMEDGAGRGIDLTSSNIDPLPNMLAGAVRRSFLGANKLAYSVLTRYKFDAKIRGSRVTRADVFTGIPGEEHFAGSLQFTSEANELWVGATWGRSLHDRVGVGITQYLTVRKQETSANLFAQALSDSGAIAIAFDVERYEFDDWSFLWKAGVGFDLSPVTLGATVTTPKLHLSGKGDSDFNATQAGIDLDGDGIPDNQFVADVQEGVPARHRSPLSIGVGGSVRVGDTRIHVAAEWFERVEPYDVLDLGPFRSQATGEMVQPHLRDATASVTNWGIGFENDFGTSSRGYLSFRTDYSSNTRESGIAVTPYDLFHLTGGLSTGFRSMHITGGLSYAWGNETIDQLIDLTPDRQEAGDETQTVKLGYQQVTFIFGFEVGI